jgi:hypothetical protein
MPSQSIPTGPPPFSHKPDEIVSYNSIQDFTDKMQKAGNRCELHSFKATDHFFMNPSARGQVPGVIDNFLCSLGYIDSAKRA